MTETKFVLITALIIAVCQIVPNAFLVAAPWALGWKLAAMGGLCAVSSTVTWFVLRWLGRRAES